MRLLKSTYPISSVLKRRVLIGQQARFLSLTTPRYNEHSRNGKKIEDFPWLLSNSQPRITKYPYEETPHGWNFFDILPFSLKHALCKWLGTRLLQLNTGFDYFPEQFLVGASLATRKAVTLLSDQLRHPEDEARKQELQHILGPDLLDRFLNAVPSDTNIEIRIPQIYDVNVDDIWITFGSPAAFSDQRNYEILRWMTIQVGLHKAKVNENEESFQEYRERVSKSIMEGIQVGVDVLIDADITLKANTKDKPDDVLIYDEGRRTLRMRFATPYFTPASKMVSGRDPETNEPINDWNWKLVDIDQLLEKESMDAANEGDE